jgi:hypothetical protein
MGGGGSVMILMKNVKADDPTAPLFSRSALQGVTEKDAVHVLLHSYWLGPGQQHPVDFALETVVKASIPGQ